MSFVFNIRIDHHVFCTVCATYIYIYIYTSLNFVIIYIYFVSILVMAHAGCMILHVRLPLKFQSFWNSFVSKTGIGLDEHRATHA